jgi:hypothetical protein
MVLAWVRLFAAGGQFLKKPVFLTFFLARFHARGCVALRKGGWSGASRSARNPLANNEKARLPEERQALKKKLPRLDSNLVALSVNFHFPAFWALFWKEPIFGKDNRLSPVEHSG